MAELTLEARLLALGEALEFPRVDTLVDDVVGALEEPVAVRPPRRWRRPLLAVAAAMVVIVATTLAVPDGRRAVARWLGFDGYRIDRVVELPEPAPAAPAPIGPLVIRGDLTTDAFGKMATYGTDVRAVTVNGRPAYWISGDQHLFITYSRDGTRREQRLAGNTLVWQQGDEIVRIEGADLTLEEALAIAASLEES